MTEVFEFGIGNAEFGKKKRRKKTEDFWKKVIK